MGFPGIREEPSNYLGFPIAPAVNFQPLFTHRSFSDSGAYYCHVVRTLGWQKAGPRKSFFEEEAVECASSLCVTIFFKDSIANVFE